MRQSARALAMGPAPDDPAACMAQAEELMATQDDISCALSERVGRVHQTG
ncbi:MAG: hypothetical protein IRZ07_17475, partial [Microbispora sp.]|nr:hypothetical protein [Microbispora sp.]